jgi:hypothetical protein
MLFLRAELAIDISSYIERIGGVWSTYSYFESREGVLLDDLNDTSDTIMTSMSASFQFESDLTKGHVKVIMDH